MFDFFKKIFSGSVDSEQKEPFAHTPLVETSGGAETDPAERVNNAIRTATRLVSARRGYMPTAGVVNASEETFDGDKTIVHLIRGGGKGEIIVKNEPGRVDVYRYAPNVQIRKMEIPSGHGQSMRIEDGLDEKTPDELLNKLRAELSVPAEAPSSN